MSSTLCEKRCNFAAMIGHSPLRLYVMGPDCTQREATEDEIRQMRDITAAAVAAGAIGFSSSASGVHVGDGGQPVPSRLADPQEVVALGDVLCEAGRGVVQFTFGPAFDRLKLANSLEEDRPSGRLHRRSHGTPRRRDGAGGSQLDQRPRG